MALVRPGHRGGIGVGKPPPPTLPSVQHDGEMLGSEWDTLAHRSMQEGGGAKETAPGRGGAKGGHLQGLQHIWTPPGYGDIF